MDVATGENAPLQERQRPESVELNPCLPGDAVHLVIAEHGFQISSGCKCRGMIRKMNEHDIQWSYDNMTEIIDVMVEEARRREIKVLGVEPPDVVLRAVARRWIGQGLRNCKRASALRATG